MRIKLFENFNLDLKDDIRLGLVELSDEGYYIDIRNENRISYVQYEIFISYGDNNDYDPFKVSPVIEPINILIEYFKEKFGTRFKHKLRYVYSSPSGYVTEYRDLRYTNKGYFVSKGLETSCLSLKLEYDKEV